MLNATTDVGTNYYVQSLQTIENEINSAMQIAESIENCHDIRPLRTKLHSFDRVEKRSTGNSG